MLGVGGQRPERVHRGKLASAETQLVAALSGQLGAVGVGEVHQVDRLGRVVGGDAGQGLVGGTLQEVIPEPPFGGRRVAPAIDQRGPLPAEELLPGRHPQPIVGVSAAHERAGEVTKRSRVYELKIRGVASDLVRAEFEDVELWEAPGATWLRTDGADTAALYGLIKRIETLGLVLLKVDEFEVDVGESGHPAPS